MNDTNNISEQEIYRWFDIFKSDNPLTEIRLIDPSGKIFSGYFKSAGAIIEAVRPYSRTCNVYFTVNPVNESCYAREQKDKLVARPKNATTDSEIVGRKFIFLDLDAKRVSGVCASDSEVAFVKQKANEVYRFLVGEGFYPPVVIFSSSGVHFYLKCSIAATPKNDELIKRFTMAVGMLFSDEHTDVDGKIFNRGRIARLPGTYSRKGAPGDPERPQRMCRFVRYPDKLKDNPIEYFEKVAGYYPEQPVPDRSNGYSSSEFDLEGFIARHGIEVTKTVEVPGGRRYLLKRCVFDPNHTDGQAMIFRHDNGALAYYCFHNSCSQYRWRDVRLKFEPDAYAGRSEYVNRREMRKRPPAHAIIPETKEKGKIWLKMSEIRRTEFNAKDYIPSGIGQIDDLMVGFKRGHISVWSGYRGSAKSTLLNMLILNGANLGYRSALWTGELSDREVKNWLYLQAAGKNENRPSRYNNFYYTPKEACDQIDPWIDGCFRLYNNEYGSDFSQIANAVCDAAAKEDTDFVILDNLMIMDLDSLSPDKYDAQKELMKSLLRLAKDLNIHIHIVAHPNKNGTFLRPNNISGTGNIPDLAQNVFIVHRINRDFEINARDFLSRSDVENIINSGCTNVIEVCKCRDKGSAAGNFIRLWFEPESNRLKNSVAENVIYGWQNKEADAEEIDDLPEC